jgi:two-component system chemotaxis response regulator CheY
MHVLVVDEHPVMASIVSTVLRQIGFAHIDEARSVAAALKKLRNKNYGLVISDEKPSSRDLMHKLGANPELASTPFLMLTAREPDLADARPCARIAKPFNARMLHNKIESLLAA